MLRLQEVLLWIKSVVEECGENITTEQLKDYVWKTLNSGKKEFDDALHHRPCGCPPLHPW
ncbi:hypothetical protein NC653_022543 [Populus alba x Populus x berolinensis]|uniref:Uncharacterized protein n=1 Tax=Populus alba x Populus x berolinensis TaxID=444605 RepID=A0AAD6Q9W0_9ROSI|nr:hypothetical protein NC653_022543 [Populus alba x Populus x berolinensis]